MSKRFQPRGQQTPLAEPPAASTETIVQPKAQGEKTAALVQTIKPPRKNGPDPHTVQLDAEVVPRIDLNGETRMIGNRPGTVRDVITSMASVGATIVDIAQLLGVSEPTMHKIFKRQPEVRKVYDDGKLNMRMSARMRLFKLAETQAGPAIFIAKNELGYRDNFDVTANVDHKHSGLVELMLELDGKYGKQIKTKDVTPPPGGKLIEHES